MIPGIKNYRSLDNYMLYVEFDDGYKVMYDIRMLPLFRPLLDICGLFKQVRLDSSRTYFFWNEEIDLASDCIYEYGVVA
ncbi:MAG: DUF2442 domain-containing protein [Paludibacteraceae bacterium]|nr:DUF2442 domain-containing protein [Paludibacteraceae bacterium]